MNRSKPSLSLLISALLIGLSLTGSSLSVQALTPTPSASPAASDLTATPEPQITYVVRPGDTLLRIARQYNTTVNAIARANNISNPDNIRVGQRLIIPTDVAPTPTPNVTSSTNTPPDTSPNAVSYGRGITLALQGQDPALLVQNVISLNVQWAKIELDWRSLEPAPQQYDFSALDTVIFGLSDARIKLLVTLDNTPAWARSAQLEDGPPDDFTVFGRFAGTLAARYVGRITAYQVWNEPNLRREWFSDIHSISPASYADLFSQAQSAIRSADPNALIITAGLAPTGFNDGVNALNDRLYLQALYDIGVAEAADGVAVHALGFANPPDSRCCQATEGVLTHFESRSFYFYDTLEDYHAIAQANADNRPLWVTRFGWGTAEGSPTPSNDFVYVTYTSQLEQAQYIPDAFGVGQSLGYVGPMFVYNLNGCTLPDARAEVCFFSLTGPDGLPRAAFNALKAMPR